MIDNHNKKGLLFIYNKPDINEIFGQHFKLLGYNIFSALTWKDATQLVKENNVNVIVCEADIDGGIKRDLSGLINFLNYIDDFNAKTKVIIATSLYERRELSKISQRVFAIFTKGEYLMTFEELTHTIQRALGTREKTNNSEMTVFPIWHNRDFLLKRDLCFVLMPFTTDWSNRIWNRHLRKIVENCGLKAQRADEFIGHDIMEDIWQGINEAKIVIADISGKNPNVFYELGIAHTLGKRVILITQSFDEIPFDINRYRIIKYEDNSDGYDTLSKELTKVLKM